MDIGPAGSTYIKYRKCHACAFQHCTCASIYWHNKIYDTNATNAFKE